MVILPSETEGLPLVLLEAMAYGVPFVATDVGAVRTLAEDNPDVQVVPLDNEALIAAINDVATSIRSGRIRGGRLQEYHRSRYSYELLSKLWTEALLSPATFWTNGEMGQLSKADNQHSELQISMRQ
jgi:glycosyltransferase involved in cell wall biosynthesis